MPRFVEFSFTLVCTIRYINCLNCPSDLFVSLVIHSCCWSVIYFFLACFWIFSSYLGWNQWFDWSIRTRAHTQKTQTIQTIHLVDERWISLLTFKHIIGMVLIEIWIWSFSNGLMLWNCFNFHFEWFESRKFLFWLPF